MAPLESVLNFDQSLEIAMNKKQKLKVSEYVLRKIMNRGEGDVSAVWQFMANTSTSQDTAIQLYEFMQRDNDEHFKTTLFDNIIFWEQCWDWGMGGSDTR